MNCKELHNDLLLYAEGSLDKEASENMQSHIGECSECKAKLSFLKAGMHIIEKEKKTQSDPFFFTRVEQRMHNRQEENSSLSKIALRRLQQSMLYLGVVIAILGGIWLGNYSITAVDEYSTMQEEIVAAEVLPSYLTDQYTFE